MENTDKAVAAMLEQFQQFVNAYGAEAVDAALFGVRIAGAINLVYGVGGVILGLIFLLFGIYWYRCIRNKEFARDHERQDYYNSDGYILSLIGSVASAIFGFIIVVANMVTVINVVHWIAVFNPKMWIAHRLIMKLF